MQAVQPPVHGAITRRLSPSSFETSNPEQCAIWLRAIGYIDEVPHGRLEYARLRIDAGVCVVYQSGLVICLGGGQA